MRRPGQHLAFADGQLERAAARRTGDHMCHARREQGDLWPGPPPVITQIGARPGEPEAGRNIRRLPERNDDPLAQAECAERLEESLMDPRLRPRIGRLAESEWSSVYGRSRPGADMVRQIKPLVDVAFAKAPRRAFRENERIGALPRTGQLVDPKGCEAEFPRRIAQRFGDPGQRARSRDAVDRCEDEVTVWIGVHRQDPALPARVIEQDTAATSSCPDEITPNI